MCVGTAFAIGGDNWLHDEPTRVFADRVANGSTPILAKRCERFFLCSTTNVIAFFFFFKTCTEICSGDTACDYMRGLYRDAYSVHTIE